MDNEGEYIRPIISKETIQPKGRKIWELRTHGAYDAEGWQDWSTLAKKEFPVRYWLDRTCFPWFRHQASRFDRIKWWVCHRTIDRYHVVDTGLEPGYYDCDYRILHSVFSLFNEFMEVQQDGHVDWESEFHSKEWGEMNEVWDWWKARSTREELFEKEHPHPVLPDDWGFMSVVNRRYDEEALMIEWKRISDLHRAQEIVWDQEDEDMLIRVMKLRLRLWD